MSTPSERSMAGRQAAHERWSREPDREAATAPMRIGFDARFERQVDPEGVLDPVVRAKLADSAKKAYMTRLQLASAKARAAKKEQHIRSRRSAA